MQQNRPRRDFLRHFEALAALSTPAMAALGSEKDALNFPPIYDKSEKPEQTEPPGDALHERVGIAIVGLGRIAINEMLPAIERASMPGRPRWSPATAPKGRKSSSAR
jgi:hypothetical protein